MDVEDDAQIMRTESRQSQRTPKSLHRARQDGDAQQEAFRTSVSLPIGKLEARRAVVANRPMGSPGLLLRERARRGAHVREGAALWGGRGRRRGGGTSGPPMTPERQQAQLRPLEHLEQAPEDKAWPLWQGHLQASRLGRSL